MKPPPFNLCPCGSGEKFKKCCRRWHDGAPAPTAEALMRARYSAYAMGNTRYLRETTHPGGPHYRTDNAVWDAELREYIGQTKFLGLSVHEHVVLPTEAYVSFWVHTVQAGHDHEWGERSRFLKVNGRWLYVSGEVYNGRA